MPEPEMNKQEYYIWKLWGSGNLRQDPLAFEQFEAVIAPDYLEYMDSGREYHHLCWNFLFGRLHFGPWELDILKRKYIYSNRPNDPIMYEINKFVEFAILIGSIIGIIWVYGKKYKEAQELKKKI